MSNDAINRALASAILPMMSISATPRVKEVAEPKKAAQEVEPAPRKVFEVPVYAQVEASSLEEAINSVKRFLVPEEGCDIAPEVTGLYLAEDITTDYRGRRIHRLHPGNMDLAAYNEFLETKKFKEGDVVCHYYKHRSDPKVGKVIAKPGGRNLFVKWHKGPSLEDELTEEYIFLYNISHYV